MDEKMLTVDERQRAFAREAAEVSEKCFEHFREALKLANRLVQLKYEELQFLGPLRLKNQWRCPEDRIYTRLSRLMPMCPKMPEQDEWSWALFFAMTELPLDEMEADAKVARAEMLTMKTGDEWKQ